MQIREKSILPNTAVAIIDFDNVLGDFFNVNNSQALISSINSLITLTFKKSNSNNILLRLYGGWMTEGQYTNRASAILQSINSESFFPTLDNGTIINGEIQLVSSLNAIDNLVWGGTYVRRNGLPHLRLEMDILNQHCIGENHNCPAKMLRKFSKTPNKECFIEDCSVVNSTAFVVGSQKMVDTMMTIDILDYSANSNVDFVCVFSDDCDLLPPIIRANLNTTNEISLFLKNNELINKYSFLQDEYDLDINNFSL